MNIHPDSLTDDLDWQAFCYAAGELSPTATAEFEERLGSDQAAREALARAIELTQAIASAESLASVVRRPAAPAPDFRRFNAGNLAWGAMATAALVGGLVLWSGTGGGPQPNTAEQLGRGERELAVAWSHTRSELATASDADFWFPAHLNSGESPSPDTANSGAVLDDVPDGSLDESLVGPTPDWLMAAVEGYSPGADDADPSDPADRGELTPFDDERTEN